MQIDFLLFDAANTLIHKPSLFPNYNAALEKHGFKVDLAELIRHHKLISELIQFPDRTDKDFYHHFNSAVLYSLGVLPREELLEDIFTACTYLEWDRFNDTDQLNGTTVPMGILSNFKSSLSSTIYSLFGGIFKSVITSEESDICKPSRQFYELAIKTIGVPPHRILFIGDSLKLDIAPALQCGINAFLIDREKIFPLFKNRIDSLKEINSLLRKLAKIPQFDN